MPFDMFAKKEDELEAGRTGFDMGGDRPGFDMGVEEPPEEPNWLQKLYQASPRAKMMTEGPDPEALKSGVKAAGSIASGFATMVPAGVAGAFALTQPPAEGETRLDAAQKQMDLVHEFWQPDLNEEEAQAVELVMKPLTTLQQGFRAAGNWAEKASGSSPQAAAVGATVATALEVAFWFGMPLAKGKITKAIKDGKVARAHSEALKVMDEYTRIESKHLKEMQDYAAKHGMPLLKPDKTQVKGEKGIAPEDFTPTAKATDVLGITPADVMAMRELRAKIERGEANKAERAAFEKMVMETQKAALRRSHAADKIGEPLIKPQRGGEKATRGITPEEFLKGEKPAQKAPEYTPEQLKSTEVEVSYRDESGRKYTVKDKAETALKDIDTTTEKYLSILECL